MLTIHSITPVPTRSRADDALAYALDRLLPELNHLELRPLLDDAAQLEKLDEWARDRVGECVA